MCMLLILQHKPSIVCRWKRPTCQNPAPVSYEFYPPEQRATQLFFQYAFFYRVVGGGSLLNHLPASFLQPGKR